jgi:TonB family protein
MKPSFSPGLGMLPEPEGRTASFVTSSVINLAIVVMILMVGSMARHVLQQHYEMTVLVVPAQPLPPPINIEPVMPKLPPVTPKPETEAPKIQVHQPGPREPDPIQMQAEIALPAIKAAKPQFILAPQTKAALPVAMPAQTPHVYASTVPVHLGQTFGVTPNLYANRPATVPAIGNPYAEMQDTAVAPHDVVSSAGIGNGTRSGSNAGYVDRVASAGIPNATATANIGEYRYGKVASAGIPTTTVTPVVRQQQEQPTSTSMEVISKPLARYTTEARALRVEGDVVLRVTFLANGQVVVHGIVKGLGHGLDEEARRVAEQIRFRPATRNGRPVDLTTNITITFQLT